MRLWKKQTLRSVLAGRWTRGEKPQRVKGSYCAQSPLYTQWPRLKSIRGPQYRNASRAGHVEIRSQARAVNGIAALVTTPLRLLVTRAPSDQASQAPGVRLSQDLRLQPDAVTFGRRYLSTGVHRRRWTRPRPWRASLRDSLCRGGQGPRDSVDSYAVSKLEEIVRYR